MLVQDSELDATDIFTSVWLCPGGMQNPVMPHQPAPPQAQQPPVAYPRQPGGAPRMGAQRGPGLVNLSSSYPPVFAQPMGRCAQAS